MSSVKMQGNAGGTGSIILASPNTNNNQTLTLPDATGQVIATDGTGAAVLPRVDSASEGGQINFNRAVDNVANWSIDSYGSTTTPLLRFIDGANVRMALDGSGNVGIGTSSPNAKLNVVGSISSSGASSGYVTYRRDTNASAFTIYSPDYSLSFFDNNVGERMRIDSSGNLLVGTASSTGGKVESKSGSAGGECYRSWNATDSGTRYFHYFGVVSGSFTNVGAITSNGSTTTYATSSDYRLKENVQPMTGALSKVSALKPVTYTWSSTQMNDDGFIAHELAEVFPNAVIGEKDAVDADGNPIYQGIDTSFLVATLTAAIQEQQALITSQAASIAALTERITALEAK